MVNEHYVNDRVVNNINQSVWSVAFVCRPPYTICRWCCYYSVAGCHSRTTCDAIRRRLVELKMRWQCVSVSRRRCVCHRRDQVYRPVYRWPNKCPPPYTRFVAFRACVTKNINRFQSVNCDEIVSQLSRKKWVGVLFNELDQYSFECYKQAYGILFWVRCELIDGLKVWISWTRHMRMAVAVGWLFRCKSYQQMHA